MQVIIITLLVNPKKHFNNYQEYIAQIIGQRDSNSLVTKQIK